MNTVMRTYPSGLFTDQKNRCEALSTLSSDLLLNGFFGGSQVRITSLKSQRKRNRKTARPPILGNLIRKLLGRSKLRRRNGKWVKF